MTTLAAIVEQGRWSDTRRATAEDTYDEVRDLIYHTVWGIVRKHGGDFDDFLSEANEVFLTSYANFDGSCPFTNWLRQNIVYRLIDCVRGRCNERSRLRPEPNDSVDGVPVWSLSGTERSDSAVDSVPDTHSTWRITELLEELGDDARTVISLVVETPSELNSIIQAKGDQPRNYRSSIRQYLAELGWTAARVAESFNEIRHALAE